MSRFVLTCLLALALGCSDRQIEKREPVALDTIPANVMKVAHEKLPGVKFDRAWRKSNGEYEIAGKSKTGKVYEIDMKPDGTVTEVEGTLDEQGKPK